MRWVSYCVLHCYSFFVSFISPIKDLHPSCKHFKEVLNKGWRLIYLTCVALIFDTFRGLKSIIQHWLPPQVISRPQQQLTSCRWRRQQQPALSSGPWTPTKGTNLSLGRKETKKWRLSAHNHKTRSMIKRSITSKQSTSSWRSTGRRCFNLLNFIKRLTKQMKKFVTLKQKTRTIIGTKIMRVSTMTIVMN